MNANRTVRVLESRKKNSKTRNSSLRRGLVKASSCKSARVFRLEDILKY